RVHDLNRVSESGICRKQKLIKYFRALERVCHTLAEAAELRDISCYLLDSQLERKLSCRRLSGRQCGWNIVISVKSRHFLRKIGKTEEILTECRSDDFFCCRIIFEINLFKICKHFFFRN